MKAREPNTPGIFGYLLCMVTSFFACAVLVVVPMTYANGVPEAAVIYLPVGLLVIAVIGTPVALAGVLAMDLLCRSVPNQAVHVAVAALVGGVATVYYLPIVGLVDTGFVSQLVAVVVGLSAAIGRGAVIPLVTSRRRLAAVGQLSGTARW